MTRILLAILLAWPSAAAVRAEPPAPASEAHELIAWTEALDRLEKALLDRVEQGLQTEIQKEDARIAEEDADSIRERAPELAPQLDRIEALLTRLQGSADDKKEASKALKEDEAAPSDALQGAASTGEKALPGLFDGSDGEGAPAPSDVSWKDLDPRRVIRLPPAEAPKEGGGPRYERRIWEVGRPVPKREKTPKKKGAKKPSSGWWTPTVALLPGGAMMGVQFGKAAGGGYGPANLSPTPAQVQSHQARDRALKTSPWTAAITGTSTMLGMQLARQAGVFEMSKDPAKDAALDFLTGYGFGSLLSPGAVHRDIGMGYLNGLSFAGSKAIMAKIRGEKVEDPRYDLVAFSTVYGVKGRLPERGNPLTTNGFGAGKAVVNGVTDTGFAAVWDGVAGSLGGTLRALGEGGKAGEEAGRGLAGGVLHGAVTRGLQNVAFGTRVRLSNSLWDEAADIAHREAGARLTLHRDDVDIRVGGLYSLLGGSQNATTFPDWISFKNASDPLDPSLLAHERYHMEHQVLDRGALNFYFQYILLGGKHDETSAYGINRPAD